MNSQKKPTLVRVFVLFALFAGFVLVWPNESRAQNDGLFSDVSFRPENDMQSIDPTVIRARYMQPDFNALMDIGPTRIGTRLPLNLFDDAIFSGIVEAIVNNRSGSVSWIGHLDGVDFGTFIFVVKEGVMVGTIKMMGATYQISYVRDGVHAIYQIDEGALPTELEPISFEPQKDMNTPNASTTDDGSIIDVLVIYTDDARFLAGSTTAIENRIDEAIAGSNIAYANSNISQRLNLVHTEEVNYDEDFIPSGLDKWWDDALGHVTSPSDGIIDNIHTIRDTYCADEVVFLVERSDGCGIAWIDSTVEYGFAVVSSVSGCATANYSLVHELGHNMGARHDWYVDNTDMYAHGYVNPPDRWRTIMAYNSECSPNTCTRLQYFSNPSITYGGDPMGIPDGTKRGCSASSEGCDADVHTKLNSTASTVANFKDSTSCAAPSTYTISGYVRDAGSNPISGVNVSFEGYKPAVTTNASGFYSQSGFINAPYDVSFSRSGYSFSPSTSRVTVNSANATLNSTSMAGPVVYNSHLVNDNNINDSRGDDDGIAECGEIIELFVDLTNQGSATASTITATLSTTDTYVTFLYNTASAYPDIAASGTQTNSNDFDLEIDSLTPDGHVVPFTLNITASNGGPWTDTFNLTIGCNILYFPLIMK